MRLRIARIELGRGVQGRFGFPWFPLPVLDLCLRNEQGYRFGVFDDGFLDEILGLVRSLLFQEYVNEAEGRFGIIRVLLKTFLIEVSGVIEFTVQKSLLGG